MGKKTSKLGIFFAGNRLSKRYRWFVTLTVILATSAMVVEATIINVAIPSIMRHFAMSQDTAQWLSTGFLGAMAATMLLASWFEEAFGHRRTYMIALTLFVFSSLLGGLADNSALLIVARILQGAIAGLIQPLGMVAIYRVFPESERGKAMSIFGLGVVLAPALGPAVGGYLVDVFSWRAIFFVTVPVCTLSALLSSRYLPGREASHQRRPFDWFGCLLLALFLASLLMGFAAGHKQGWLSIGFLVRLAVTLSLAVGFVVLESKLTHPLLNLKLLMTT
ncbi:MAG: MFS transporter, partial [Methylococcales bacterium]|nr:MFS transporter [Methylococcales bacterium]